MATQFGDRELERQADRRGYQKYRMEDRVIHKTSTLPCMAKFVYSSAKLTTKFLTSVAKFTKFIGPDWGVKSTLAKGCYTGPPGYIST